MKLKVSTEAAAKPEAMLYLLELEIDGTTVYKIGITSRKIEERVTEILSSHFGIYRYFPYCRPKRFRKLENAYEHEQALHKYLKEYQYHPYNKFDGSTELFTGVNLDVLVELCENAYEGTVVEEREEYELCEVCGKEKKFVQDEQVTCGTDCKKEDDDNCSR